MAGNIYHSFNGTVLTITSDSGTSSCDLKGATGDTGIRGPQGPKGEKGNGIDSVNGKIGDVTLTYEDVGALPDTYVPPVTKVNSKTGEVTLTYEDVGALPNTYVAPVTSVNTKTGAVQLTYSDVDAAAANHTHTAADVGALAAGGTAADSSKLGGKSASEYALKTDTAPDSSKLSGKTLTEIMLTLYPVGAIYISAVSTSPASLFGGTWEQLKDRFLLGAGDSYDAGSIGGEATHALTVAEIAKHYHNSYVLYDQNGYGFDSIPYEFYLKATKGDGWGTTGPTAAELTNKNTRRIRNTSETGQNAAHNNMPPYLAVYMWKRVS